MKTIIILFSSLAFILSANSASAPDPVLDFAGKIIRAGDKYYVLPTVGKVDFGGLVLKVGNNSCSDGIARSSADDNGLSLSFTPVNNKKGVIRVSTDVNIKFPDFTGCKESNVWKLTYEKFMKQYAVVLGGVEGNPGQETLYNWFKIAKTSDGYKFVFCPSVCSSCKVKCSDIGLVTDEDGVPRLALNDDPYTFNFYGVTG
ncbi:hypothetical protein QVD17_28752 [Tagetes erecta]|uniref:Miraculin n=1 Tax=Tagetes erecta TaxID=13708 RepID=A0AAD8KFK7_TARER|nr:hypothetical protein QVD17_28752 [Tagetes erecta]